MTVVKIGGCNGSGKTSIVRHILDSNNFEKVGTNSKTTAYKASLEIPHYKERVPFVILGSYTNQCGGMDTISDKLDRLALLEQYNDGENVVIYEGLITGKTYGAMGAISEREDQKGKWLYVYMDTPFDTCVHRVLERRAAKGSNSEFNPERTMRPTFKSVLSAANTAKQRGHQVYWVNHKFTPEVGAHNLIHVIANFRKTGEIYADART